MSSFLGVPYTQGNWNLPIIGNIPDFKTSEGLGYSTSPKQYVSPLSGSSLLNTVNSGSSAIPTHTGQVLGLDTTRNLSGSNNNQTFNNNPNPTGNTGGDTGGERDNYVNSLNSYFDSALGGLNQPYQNEQGNINRNYEQGVSDYQASAQDSYNQLDTSTRKANENQAKNLRDIGTNLQNQYQAGNVYLGTRGAGDSSAANMYSYALNKVGSQQRGDVMNQTSSILADIQDRKTQISNSVTQGLKQLMTEKQNLLSTLANQFLSAQQEIRNAKGQNVVELNKQLYDGAVSKMNSIQNTFNDNVGNLRTWALNNAQTVQQLQSNLAGVSGVSYNMPSAQQLGTVFNAPGNTQSTYWSTDDNYQT